MSTKLVELSRKRPRGFSLVCKSAIFSIPANFSTPAKIRIADGGGAAGAAAGLG
jgi:hypothetical protein